METENNTPQTAPQTDAERYPLIVNSLYRGCVERICQAHEMMIENAGGAHNLKSTPLIQLARAGHLNADFMLAHFAGIFDKNSPLSSGQRRLVKAILTEAAQRMAAIKTAALQEEARKKAEAEAKQKEGGEDGGR